MNFKELLIKINNCCPICGHNSLIFNKRMTELSCNNTAARENIHCIFYFAHNDLCRFEYYIINNKKIIVGLGNDVFVYMGDSAKKLNIDFDQFLVPYEKLDTRIKTLDLLI